MKALSLLLLLVVQAPPARPQDVGVITGMIRAADGRPAAGVRVFARPTVSVLEETILEAQAETDVSGRYRLEIAPGQYFIGTGFIGSPTWYPSTSDIAAARPVAVSSNVRLSLDITALAGSVLAGSIQLQVVSAASGSPLPNVTVEFSGMLAPAPVPGTLRPIARRIPNTIVLTDASGNVAFRNLAPGTYQASARLSGHFGPELRTVAISSTDTVRRLQIQLIPSASISGQVKDAAGGPLASARVWAGILDYTGGHPRLIAKATAPTDAQGRYRLTPLEPGTYHVLLEQTENRGLGFTSVYYPGTTVFNEASTVAVRHAQDLAGIDFNAVTVKTFSISGRVRNSSTWIPSFQVVPRDPGAVIPPDPILMSNTSRTADGAFVLSGIPAGAWDVFPVSQSPFSLGAGSVDIVDRDVQGVQIGLDPLVAVRGRIVMPAGVAVPPQVSVSLVPRDSKPRNLVGHLTSGQRVRASDGAFVFAGVPRGRYSVRLSDVPEDYHVEGLRAGTQDFFETGVFEVGPNAMEPLEVILGNGGATVRGFFNITLVYMTADQLRNVRVTLVPSGTRRSNLELYRTIAIPRAGEAFSFSGIVPGDYKVFAWASLPPGAEKFPDFLRRYEDFGAVVRVGSGSVGDVQVAVIPMP
jgi:hypothetical protein